MSWEPVTRPVTPWASQPNERTYYASYYAVDDYVDDEEWTLGNDPAGTWEVQS